MKLYIGNIPYTTSESDLRQFISDSTSFEELIYPIDNYTDQPRGFAFITMADRNSGEEAIRHLDGSELNGRRLRVNEARQKEKSH